MHAYVLAAPQVICFANDNTASIDEHWVRTTLMFLRSNMVAANLVRRDFEEIIQEHGDVINVRRPQDFAYRRTADFVNLETQDATATKIQVPLDQWATVSFLIGDGEGSKSFANLVDQYLEPAALALSEGVDRVVLGQAARLLTFTAGELGGMTSANARQFLVETDKVLNDNRCPQDGRNLILSTNAKSQLLQTDIVVEADKRGDQGTALRNASIGRIYNFDTFMSQNVNSVSASSVDRVSGTVDTTAYPAGHTGVIDLTDASITTTPVVGEYVVIEGEGFPHVLSAATLTADDITLEDALKKPVAAGADVDIYNSIAVDLVAGYAAGHYDFIHVDGLATTKPLQKGQLLAVGTGASRVVYTIIDVKDFAAGDQDVLLDRPLEGALANDTVLFPGPAGDMNIAFHRDAMTLVNRPLAPVRSGIGAASVVVSMGGLSMRMTESYDGLAQNVRVTADMLLGVQILDQRLACVLFS